MNLIGNLINIDFLSVGIAIAGNLILGTIVLLSRKKSATGTLFFLLTLAIAGWSTVNYLSYQVTNEIIALWLVRGVMFFATLIGAFFLFFIDAFPGDHLRMPRKYIAAISLFTSITMCFSLTPLIFKNVIMKIGAAPQPTIGIGIISFIVVPVLAIIFGIILLIQRTVKANEIEKKPFRILSSGVAIMFGSILILNFIFPSFLNNTEFIPLSAAFTLPFVIFTAYAIIRHQLLSIKIITTEILAFILSIVTLLETVLSENVTLLVFRAGIFALVLGFSVLLIRSVRKEVEQREKLQQLTGELETKNAKLEDLDKMRAEFIRIASHDIRSPMNNVKGFAQLIYDGTYGQLPKEVLDTAHKIKDNADRTLELAANFLDSEKIDAGKMDYVFTEVDISKMISDLVSESKPSAMAKGLDLQFESGTPSLKIKADVNRIRQVFQNLIGNSIKYTKEGFVKVEMKDQNDYVQVVISDSGLGMSHEFTQKIFQRFSRDEATKKEIQGTGLGLYIAKQIVTVHHGQIWAESDGIGKGSKFIVRLAKQFE